MLESAGAPSSAGMGGSGAGAAGNDDAGAAGSDDEGGCSDLLSGLPVSQYVFAQADGTLGYRDIDARGNRIMDFSHAGYRGGGVALPRTPVVATLEPSGGDDSAAIQAALDSVAKQTLSADGLRGAVLLAAGTFKVSAPLTISASGVVLRGSGSGTGGTAITLGTTPHLFLNVAGTGTWKTSGKVAVSDRYVASGSRSLSVSDASGFKVGDAVLVDRPVTQAWLHFMGMDTLVRDGEPQTWLAVGTLLHADRHIAAISDKQLTFDVPLSDSYDAKYLSPLGASVSHYTFAGRIAQVGIEGLRLVAPPTAVSIAEPQFQALQMDAVEDGWASDLALENTVNSVYLGATSRRITVQDLTLTRSLVADGSAGYPLEITIAGTQILVQRADMQGANIYTYATAARVTGPNVYLNATGSGVHNRVEPHQRWATGLLADHVSGEQINFYNRNNAGSGHGWTIGWGVVWNSEATSLNIEQPPGAQNLCIGCVGKQASSTVPGLYESTGKPVGPKSLYLAQLCVRLGRAAVDAIAR